MESRVFLTDWPVSGAWATFHAIFYKIPLYSVLYILPVGVDTQCGVKLVFEEAV